MYFRRQQLKSIRLTSKDLIWGRMFGSEGLKQIAVAISFRELPELALCNGEETGIASSYIVINGDLVKNFFENPEWRDPELLEAADLNADEESELYFADHSTNFDGFSVVDFKTGNLTKKGFTDQ